jgi:hypothetical protein
MKYEMKEMKQDKKYCQGIPVDNEGETNADELN